MSRLQSFVKFARSIIRFGITSLAATVVDILVFMFVFQTFLPIFWAEVAAAFCGMIINFFMQKRYVFILQRQVFSALGLSVIFSFVLMFLGAAALSGLASIKFFAQQLILAKILVMSCKFILNYFSKKWIFEKSIRH